MWRKITQGIQKISQRLTDSVVGIVGFGVATQGERGLEGGLIVAEHLKGPGDTRAGSRVNDLIDEGRVTFAHGT